MQVGRCEKTFRRCFRTRARVDRIRKGATIPTALPVE
jgi:hypothetical protein